MRQGAAACGPRPRCVTHRGFMTGMASASCPCVPCRACALDAVGECCASRPPPPGSSQGVKCKFSHDLTIGARKARVDLHCDLRELPDEESKKGGAFSVAWSRVGPPQPCV